LVYQMLDSGLNGINGWVNRTVAQGWTSGLSRFFQDGPARICIAALKPVWELTGGQVEGAKGMEARILAKFRSSFFSIGSAGVFAVGFLLFLFLL